MIPPRNATLVLPMREGAMLLAMKKRGFGAGRWNGMGGKPHEGESIPAAAVRELKEEIGLQIKEIDLEPCATLDFFFENRSDWDQRVHVFFVRRWTGSPTESEEMRPQWFPLGEIPFDAMWPDDRHWLPFVLAEKSVNAQFFFDNKGEKILRQEIQ